MTIREVAIDFDEDFGIEASRIFVRGLTSQDVVVGKFTAPDNDPKFTLGVVHTAETGNRMYTAIMTDSNGVKVAGGDSTQPNFRMRTADPGRRGQNLRLKSGGEYTITVKAKYEDDRPADFFFSVNT